MPSIRDGRRDLLNSSIVDVVCMLSTVLKRAPKGDDERGGESQNGVRRIVGSNDLFYFIYLIFFFFGKIRKFRCSANNTRIVWYVVQYGVAICKFSFC